MTVARNSPRTETDLPERKTDRIELRVTPSVGETIRRAAAVSGLTAGDLAYESARRVLDDHERMHLDGADREVFLAALLQPAEPTARLVSALRRRRDLIG